MESPIPSEFAVFVRDVAMRAIDNLARRAHDLTTPIRGVVRSWSKLSKGDKDLLIDELIASAQANDAARHEEKPKTRRAVKRFDPEEVEKTLPKKPRKKAAAKKGLPKKK
jgi:hypothetical protein